VDLNAFPAPELVPETLAAVLGVHLPACDNVTETLAPRAAVGKCPAETYTSACLVSQE
jgi:hypothetical protein